MHDEGYIKFNIHWDERPTFKPKDIMEINQFRKKLYLHKLIGVYPDGIGFGNISMRWKNTSQFIISGSKTGSYRTLEHQHYALVTQFDVEKNTVWCQGLNVASSESMSHAVIYQHCPDVQAVIHVHHLKLWKNLLDRVPTTAEGAAYGTPAMAKSILNLFETTNLLEEKLFVMKSHEEGVIAFGDSLAEATAILLKAIED